MSDETIIQVLRAESSRRTPVETAELLGELTGGSLTQSKVIFSFSRAFPQIPLRKLIEAGAWSRVGGGGMCDQEFNELLRPWFGQKTHEGKDV